MPKQKQQEDVKRWIGPRGTCNICGADISEAKFIDGRTTQGPWALMCLDCHAQYGVGLGTGRGQMYHEDGTKYRGLD